MTATPLAAPSGLLPAATPSRAVAPVALPGCALTVVVTALFGLLGLVPAAVHASRAEQAGASGRVYWEAFGTTFAVCVVFYVVALAALLTSLSTWSG
ncbi:hypothetical protein TEK04_15005 [Klenkia sp. LSe6-5]|uniref:DUF4190 domain-containing protein n=1 Tax=Klenkia sesuvii TaxID=3103137 RepID=A0ABU8DW14_9ACTN